ncbi:Modification methylase HhaI [[Ruminococcus] torques]|jgi:DNA (cytosine-5)-methyltransferase 1|uniref:Cytosine-specific methyltransferase n=2 Tax=Clostridia TaxID=186801 RepID=A0A174BWI9_9FIRM|nr:MULTISPECIES: DNA (cytosine-5-)-methyltransferase [Clostridia]OUP71381.1 DNA (cytosine-5-)-methyltransferase [Anaerotruncus colihominis]OUP75492.1 DNA (cytosine-5-)-methyltransferase [Anaerotruncus colihominis]CUO03886.1 Modification methylase HhaI [[Ruminococcus] torques]DAK78569.1 MAG TPA: Cytosine specific methyltransferase [Caudoviricetes sp.]
MEQNKLTLGSLFDGSGGFPLGGLISGITPVWASEIEPFPIRVTTKRLPFIKHYGDVSKMNGADIEPVDIITFGSPCQDMSIAGRREGLDGSRSSLFYEAVRIVKEMRCKTNGRYPRYIIWENVPGAFSSNKGADFQSVLEEVCSVKGYEIHTPRPEGWPTAGEIVADDFSLAWRVFDAQYWGVPQRRKRIYLVADLAGGSAGKILFESEGVSGYTPQGFRSWQGAAGASEKGSGAAGCVCLNDQGGNRMDVTDGVTCTLRAEAHHPPCVMESAGFCTEHSAHSRSIGYEEETSPTLRAGTVPAAVYENHSQDTRYTGPLKTAPTVMSTYGTGGNNQPFVVETPKTLKIRSGCEGGGKGALIQENKSATLGCNNDQTVFVPKVYGICSKQSHAMQSDNPHSGFYEADTSRCLDRGGGNPSCNQGGMAVVAVQGSMIGRSDKNGPQGSGVNEDVSFTLDATDRHAVAYGIDRATYNMGRNAKFGITVETEIEPTMVSKGPGAVGQPIYHSSKSSFHTNFTDDDVTETLVATDFKDPPTVSKEPDYIVRRLTPTECARLQGFPDWWCSNLETDEPTEEEIEFWTEVFETHRRVMGASSKPKSRNQIIKWLKDPHSDSAEYKMWGNGVALPNVCFVLSGIVYYAQLSGE